MMIQCQHIAKGYGANTILTDVTCDIGNKERVGLIGRNGCGKTTLLKLINGSEKPEAGQLAIKKGARIGYLEQVPYTEGHETVRDVLERSFAEPKRWQQEMRELEQLMSEHTLVADERQFADLLQRYGERQERFERAGGYELEARLARVAAGLGIPESQFARSFASLSGGEKTKIGLASMLLAEPDILLLDEPTNHLDMAAIDWLEQFLQAYAGTVVVISHDRYFLDRVVTKIIELEDGEAITYYANYTNYQKEKEARLLQQFADYQEQQKKMKQMQESIKQLIEWGNRSNPPNAGFHRRAASMQKALDRMVKLKRPNLERKAMELDINLRDRSGVQVVTLERVSKSYDGKKLFHDASERLRYGERVALIGGNGTGKSTLLKCILGKEHLDEGEVKLGSRVDVGYLAQDDAPASEESSVLTYFREAVGMEAGEARGQLARFLFMGTDVFKRVRSLSGGEWSRLRFAILMHEKPNLLILDEPTNHLDIDSREALEDALEDFPGTVLAVSHDRYFINRIASKIWALENGRLVSVHGSFEHYKAKGVEAQQQMLAASSTQRDPVPRAEHSTDAAGISARTTALRIRRLEEHISELEAKLHELDHALAAPENADNASLLAALFVEREALQSELAPLYEKWLAASN